MVVFWEVGRQPLCIGTMHSLVRKGSMTSMYSLIKKVGVGILSLAETFDRVMQLNGLYFCSLCQLIS